ncbi:hypothetical protein K3N28_20280 [Glycomyces sp. TRM65418]|uniref:hypothetical protein n=1 Tax=Glycomyces sp. TRM65418 TaxID=2867006 RepID=UPI001CE65ED4|nr:hypothetical protein [Glycomyces sp. TRM65418]MCC3765403.1 hypothetical protein [Glycomyces sp. TRM65418]QZD55014.1 hypothetical protein K3N28_20185 [Glycomyces sp. TRM65418]
MNQRVRVTSPQTRLAQRRGSDAKGRLSRLSGRPPLSSLTAIDLDAAERALHRQRGLAVRTAATLAIALGVLLTAAVLTPGRLSWAVLFFAPYPVLLTLAVLHVRRAEQIEAEHNDPARNDRAPLDGASRDDPAPPESASRDDPLQGSGGP